MVVTEEAILEVVMAEEILVATEEVLKVMLSHKTADTISQADSAADKVLKVMETQEVTEATTK